MGASIRFGFERQHFSFKPDVWNHSCKQFNFYNIRFCWLGFYITLEYCGDIS